MNTRRLSTRTIAVFLAAAFFVAIVLVASGNRASSAPKDADEPALNRMEHQAQQYLSEAHEAYARALNQREHRADQDVDESAPASGTVVPTPPALNACSARLAQAWRDLGHFSDGYETYLLRQPPCSSVTIRGPTSTP